MSIEDDIIFSLKKIQENTETFAPDITADLSVSQVHCLSVIGDHEGDNVTKISGELEMTTGAITKMCKKLLNHGYVERYQEGGNHQKIYYRLTESGKKIYQSHKKLHDKTYRDKAAVLDKYGEEEKAIILRFLNDMNSLNYKTFD